MSISLQKIVCQLTCIPHAYQFEKVGTHATESPPHILDAPKNGVQELRIFYFRERKVVFADEFPHVSTHGTS